MRATLAGFAAIASVALAAALPGVLSTAGATPAAPARSTVQGDCHIQLLVVLFWPKGHGPIPRIGFPSFLLPHVEVYAYQGATTYLPSNQVSYAGTDRKNTLIPGCRRVPDKKAFNVLSARSIRAKGAVSCSFGTPAHVQVVKIAGGGVRSELRLIEPPNKLVLRAQLAPQGSNLSYSIRQCRLGKAPG